MSVSAAHGASTFGLLQTAISPPKHTHKIDHYQKTTSMQTRSDGIPSSSSPSSSAAVSITINTPSQRESRSRQRPDHNHHSHSRDHQSSATVVLPAGLHESDDGFCLPPGDFYARRGYSFHHQATRSPSSRQGLGGTRTRARARSADARLTRTRPSTTTTVAEDGMNSARGGGVHVTTPHTPNQVTPFTPRSLEEWKYVQKHGEQGQDGNVNAQEMRWLRFLITDVDGCDAEGNPWMTSLTVKGGRRGSGFKGGLDPDPGVEGGRDDVDAMSPLKWYDEQHPPTPTSLLSHPTKHHRKNSRSKSPNVDVIHYHQSIGTATVIATTAQQYLGTTSDAAAAAAADAGIPIYTGRGTTTARGRGRTCRPESDILNSKQKQQQQQKQSPQKQQPQPQPSTAAMNNVGKPRPVRRVSGAGGVDPRARALSMSLSPTTQPATQARSGGGAGGGGVGVGGGWHIEEGEPTLTENGLARLVAKLRKQQLDLGDAALKWTPDRLAGDDEPPTHVHLFVVCMYTSLSVCLYVCMYLCMSHLIPDDAPSCLYVCTVSVNYVWITCLIGHPFFD